MLESKKTTRYVFYVYLMLLTWGILFKFETNPEFIAFFLAPISEPLIVDGKIVFAEMLFNLISFIPLGVCFPLIKTNLSSLRIVGTGFLISLLFECLQYILAIGITDITDLTLNTLGVCVGLLIYQIFIRVFKSQTRKWINILGMLSLGFAYLVLLLLHLIGV
ncbi:TPA: VanZ family protein [Streptococcus pneumoniae]|nr:VanZ family protein [Streptococcus pneumoniae]